MSAHGIGDLLMALALVGAVVLIGSAINHGMRESEPPQHARDARGRFARRRKVK